MKAIVYYHYGTPDVLKLQEVEQPSPKDDEVRVKVHAASINSWDWDLLRGKPFLYRLLFGLFKPKNAIIGSDISGRIEAVGKNIQHFQPGDAVMGDVSGSGFGAFAEYICVPENALVLKPATMAFEEAAAIPQAAVLALQGLRDKGKIKMGQKVLINGAGGGVGTFAVQIAKSFGAEVTGVDSTGKLDMLRSIGADHVIDYTKADFTKNRQRYDLILDVVAYRSIFDIKRALSAGGNYVVIGGSIARMLQVLLLGPFMAITGNKKMGMLAHKPNQEDLNFINELFKSGKVVPVIDSIYRLNEAPEAFRYFGAGNTKGKLVISMVQK